MYLGLLLYIAKSFLLPVCARYSDLSEPIDKPVVRTDDKADIYINVVNIFDIVDIVDIVRTIDKIQLQCSHKHQYVF